MITIDDIKKWAKPHPTTKFNGGNGKQTRFGTNKVEFSIVKNFKNVIFLE